MIRGFEAVLRRAADGAIGREVRQEPRPRAALLDVARFKAALLDLVVNARDAMPGGGKIVFAVENVELGEGTVGMLAAGPNVSVSVADTGPGMLPELRRTRLNRFSPPRRWVRAPAWA